MAGNCRTCRRAAWLSISAIGGLMAACTPPSAMYGKRAADADSLMRRAIAQEASIDAASLPFNTVSVVPMRVITTDTAYASLGYGMAALLASDLARSARVIIVERLRVDAVLRELQLAGSGRVDTTTAPRIGRLVGARRIVVGAIDLRSGGNLRLDSYVTDAARGTVSATLSGNGTLAQLFDAEKMMAFRLFEALGVALSPAERRAIEQVPTRSLRAFLAFSKGVQAESMRDFTGAAANYAMAIRIDPGFGAATERLSTVRGNPSPFGGQISAIERASAISNELVNRPTPLVFGTGADAPATSRQQLVTITLVIRTP